MKNIYRIEFQKVKRIGVLEICYVFARSDEEALKKAKIHMKKEWPEERPFVSSFQLINDGTILE